MFTIYLPNSHQDPSGMMCESTAELFAHWSSHLRGRIPLNLTGGLCSLVRSLHIYVSAGLWTAGRPWPYFWVQLMSMHVRGGAIKLVDVSLKFLAVVCNDVQGIGLCLSPPVWRDGDCVRAAGARASGSAASGAYVFLLQVLLAWIRLLAVWVLSILLHFTIQLVFQLNSNSTQNYLLLISVRGDFQCINSYGLLNGMVGLRVCTACRVSLFALFFPMWRGGIGVRACGARALGPQVSKSEVSAVLWHLPLFGDASDFSLCYEYSYGFGLS